MLSKKELKKIPRSFDTVGDILIFSEFPKELKKKEKEIGKYLLKQLKNVKIIAKKSKFYSGKYRTPKLKILAGEKRKETIHKENGVLIKLNPEKAYFSPRSGNERLRLSKLIKKDESVLVMFSGVSPFPLVISKHSKAKEIYGIEINKKAHKYAEENIKLNKLRNVKVFKGNVKKILPKINKKFDRIIMPLPKDSEDYLKLALKYLKPKGKIHIYIFAHENDFKKLKEKYKKYKPKLIKAGSPSPGKYRVCLDLQV
jgi:tRNA (guanine37-N1)-methyltransferase